MLQIKNENVIRAGHQFDYELEDGTLLHTNEWNGECYTHRKGSVEIVYWPVYVEEPNENDGYDIIGFNAERYSC